MTAQQRYLATSSCSAREGGSHAREVKGFGNSIVVLDMASTWSNRCERSEI